MYVNGNEIPPGDLSQRFASHFDDKVRQITARSAINKSVFDSTRKIIADNLYSLFFIMGHILGGRVTVIDGDHRLLQS
jgi:hypothetical protein